MSQISLELGFVLLAFFVCRRETRKEEDEDGRGERERKKAKKETESDTNASQVQSVHLESFI